ncbi:hypothetical protein BT63DRAFT_95402 [Microthyrium microscopicum]|uniref:Inheritance of peroxisomes protein 1 n=1 Tax=Microthyrium microscopicum TaxID=703497 RepID=A0A6A6TZS5_9PEZI|nr:hypothetical protein BT63DRAFT_95402 [Microthyrium microscopicum]
MSTPSTPERAPPPSHSFPTIRRVHTLPTHLIDPTRTPPQSSHAPDSIDTLLNLDFAKVVAFEVGAPNSRPGSSSGITDSDNKEDGTLPWGTPSERTLAAGPLRIYRVPNTGVSFLNSGAFLKPILQRSQCWCVDDDANFILRVRENSYYRIELPSSSDEERHQVDALKKTLDNLCRYEKTPCPFKKGYYEIPDRPPTPVRRASLAPKEKAKKWRLNKVWEPEDADRRAQFVENNRRVSEQWRSNLKPATEHLHRISNAPTMLRTPPRRMNTYGGERSSPLSRSNESLGEIPDSDKPALSQIRVAKIPNSRPHHGYGQLALSVSSDDQASNVTTQQTPYPNVNEQSDPSHEPKSDEDDGFLEFLRRPNSDKDVQLVEEQIKQLTERMSSMATALGQMGFQPRKEMETEPESTTGAESAVADVETASISSSRDSFYSVEDLEESDLYHVPQIQPHQFPISIATPTHSRDSSIATSVPDTPRAIPRPQNTQEVPQSYVEPLTPTLTEDTSSVSENTGDASAVTPPQTLRLRRPIQRLEIQNHDEDHEEELRPTQLSIFSPRDPTKTPLSTAVIRRTCEFLLGPPAHLVTMMLRIAARILDTLPGHSRRRSIPGAWSSDDESGTESWDEVDEVDDYDYPLRKMTHFVDASDEPVTPSDVGGHHNEGETWEID